MKLKDVLYNFTNPAIKPTFLLVRKKMFKLRNKELRKIDKEARHVRK
jgi:hypothetical protein